MRAGPFQVFIGVDQTGAQTHGGLRARPLPCAVVAGDRLVVTALGSGARLMLSSFTPDEVSRVLVSAGFDGAFSGRTALVVDSVFGLAPEVFVGGRRELWNLFRLAASDTRSRKGFGLKAAARFYSGLLKQSSSRRKIPIRRCEVLSGANSIFNTRPYQKNIQCGTYRVWRDLGSHGDEWVKIWNFARVHDYGRGSRPWMFEGYPSLFWREVFGFRTRKPRELVRVLSRDFVVSSKDALVIAEFPDWADAAVLAAGSSLLQKRGYFKREKFAKWRRIEGWILGLRDE
jgi:hypothetical protein